MQRVIDFFTTHLEYSESSAKASAYFRNFSKWLLEVIRNLVVVGFITLLAEKSNGWTLKILAAVAGVALLSSIYTYIDPIKPRFIPYKSKWISIALFAFCVLLVFSSLMVISFALNFALNELVKVQSAK